MVVLEDDKASFHAYDRKIDGKILHFRKTGEGTMTDDETASRWDVYGRCVEGKYQGRELTSVDAYQEFWHSWNTFNPTSIR